MNRATRKVTEEVIKVVIQRPSLKDQIIAHPFRFYSKVGGVTFGLVATTNLATTMINPSRRDLMIQYPDVFAWSLLTKSCYFGVIWPSYYIKLLTKPRSVLLLGGSVI
jgi:hypothetical protein